MKRKEYCQIGRLLCIIGFVFLAAEAIWNPFIPDESEIAESGSVLALLADWKILIPLGFIVMGIAGRRWFDLYCAVATLVSVSFFVVRVVDEESTFAGVFYYVWGSFLTKGDSYYDSGEGVKLIPAVIAVALWFCIVPLAIHRVLLMKKWKILRIILSIVTLLVWVFYVASLVGLVCEREGFYEMSSWVKKMFGREFCAEHMGTSYTIMMVLAAGLFLMEILGNLRNTKAPEQVSGLEEVQDLTENAPSQEVSGEEEK